MRTTLFAFIHSMARGSRARHKRRGRENRWGRLTEAVVGAAFACSLHKKTRVERSFWMDSNTLRVCFVFRIVLRICGWLCNMQQLQHKCWANVTWPLWHMWQQQQRQQKGNFCCPDLTFVYYVSAALIVPPTALGRGNNCATRALHCYYWQWQVCLCVYVCVGVWVCLVWVGGKLSTALCLTLAAVNAALIDRLHAWQCVCVCHCVSQCVCVWVEYVV